jgi:hypothetical protein
MGRKRGGGGEGGGEEGGEEEGEGGEGGREVGAGVWRNRRRTGRDEKRKRGSRSRSGKE